MSVEITWLGHAAFTITDGTDTVLVDPWLTGNPAATVGPDDVDPTVIVVTHGHMDHLGDAVAISKRTGAPIVAINELAVYLGRTEGATTMPGNFGGTATVAGVRVKLVPAMHTSAVDNGETIVASSAAAGAVIRVGGKTIYHAGDTALFGDMSLIGDEDLDVAILPIGGTYTMEPHDAARAVGLLRPRIVIPNHFNTFPQLQQDPQELVRDIHGTAEVRLLEPGQSTEI